MKKILLFMLMSLCIWSCTDSDEPIIEKNSDVLIVFTRLDLFFKNSNGENLLLPETANGINYDDIQIYQKFPIHNDYVLCEDCRSNNITSLSLFVYPINNEVVSYQIHLPNGMIYQIDAITKSDVLEFENGNQLYVYLSEVKLNGNIVYEGTLQDAQNRISLDMDILVP